MAEQPRGTHGHSGRKPKTIPKKSVATSTGTDKLSPPTGAADPAAVIAEVDFPVVGIGASAGGIEALGQFFDAMQPDCGCAFVVVLHLDPDHESQLARVLSAHTTMPVLQVEDGMRLEVNHVYVIAPKCDLKVSNGELHMIKPSALRGHGHPVDVLFSSLAADQRERAIAIVLSGTGSNGTEGLKAIRAEGGISLVQSPESAKYDGMPRSAISAGMADHILAPEKMSDVLLAYVRHGYVADPAEIEGAPKAGKATLGDVLEFLRARGGHDFSSYKRSTLQRRVQRRLGLRNFRTLDDYIEELRTNPDEVATLVGELMISVTGFFRDADAWAALSKLVVAPWVAERATGDSIRIWVPACSTGEEAYSLAMLVTEQAETAGKSFDLKVFATDAQEANLRKARDGVYPAAAVAEFSPTRLQRFFQEFDGSFQVRKELRDTVVFAQQNLLRDPPFSRMDLVSCRNVLIYLEPDAQQRIIALCHFALRQSGHLLLGNAETTGQHQDLFETVSKKWRIYRRLGPTRHDLIDYPPARSPVEPRVVEKPSRQVPEPSVPAAEIARRALLERFAPASVLIDSKSRVLYFHGTTRDYLEHPSGEPTRDLLTMARDGLAAKLRAAIREAKSEGKSVTVSARIREDKQGGSVAMTVVPLPPSSRGDGFFLVSFMPVLPQAEPAQVTIFEESGDHWTGERALQEELNATRAELHETIQSQEATNEELKSSNEEAISMNEELQSINEELETSKEELQSFNEELNTVNSQLQHKIGELESATNDLNNLLAGSETATLFLDDKFRIRWFSPAIRNLFDLTPSDVGRPIAVFAQKFADENLLPDAETVLKDLTPIDADVLAESGRWYGRRMLPYRTQDNRIAGVVVTFIDITDRKLAADAVNDARLYSETIVRTVQHPLLVLDSDLRVKTANMAFRELFSDFKEEPKGCLVFELGTGEWNNPPLRDLLDRVLSNDEEIHNFEIEQEFRLTGLRSMLLTACKLHQGNGDQLILLAIEDITDRKRAEQHREILVGELNHRLKNVMATVQAIASQTLYTATSMADARESFGSRLVALGKAQDLLTSENWAGANLRDIITATVEPFASGVDRFQIDGPHAWLAPGPALSIAMGVHELATNAAKYGSLSVKDGRVDIVWQLEGIGKDRQLSLIWTESGGPPVTSPTRKGFGSLMIQRVLAAELCGQVTVGYEESGVVCKIDAPMPDE